jgi:hypothetical protein
LTDEFPVGDPGYVPILTLLQHFDDVFRHRVFDLEMSWDRLAHFGYRILIPVIFPAMSDERASHRLEGSNEFGALHATFKSPTL